MHSMVNKVEKKTLLPVPSSGRPLKQRRIQSIKQQPLQEGHPSSRSSTLQASVFPIRNVQQLLIFLNDELDLGVKENDLTNPSPQRTRSLYQLLYNHFFWWAEKNSKQQNDQKKSQEPSNVLATQVTLYKKFNSFLKRLRCPITYADYCNSTALIVQKVVSNIAAFYDVQKSCYEKFASSINEITSANDENQRLLEEKQKKIADYMEKESVILEAEKESERMLMENESLDVSIRELRKELDTVNKSISNQKKKKLELKDRMSELYMATVEEQNRVDTLKEISKIDIHELQAQIETLNQEKPLIEQKMVEAQSKVDNADRTIAEMKALSTCLKKCIQSFDDFKNKVQQAEGLKQTLNTMKEGFAKEKMKEDELLNEISYVNKKYEEDEANLKRIAVQREEKRQMVDIEWKEQSMKWEIELEKLKQSETASAADAQRLREIESEVNQLRLAEANHMSSITEKYQSLLLAIDEILEGIKHSN
ncbi:hypothetical protein BDF20DRAFT_835000 [Mycotypha africana]|uniref:uncharacterized protein n=1 Tax=Mycotypha africana TaxID=64632 RepID=UPI0023017ABA|nr:uncharacterized protein BDF20DRAFT_835000 [Mycotypha africana]KAI8982373.1 hypothetical protein BDF20DRAFT_835000 [Mycotypha africana]